MVKERKVYDLTIKVRIKTRKQQKIMEFIEGIRTRIMGWAYVYGLKISEYEQDVEVRKG